MRATCCTGSSIIRAGRCGRSTGRTGPMAVLPIESERNRQLLEKLMEWLSIAEGGFVGARDRTARQIQKEKELLDWTRSEARALKATKQYGADRASFALALARRACQRTAVRMGVRACAAILLAWERCEHLREGRLCARAVLLVAGRGLAGECAARGADLCLRLALRRTAFQPYSPQLTRSTGFCARVSGPRLP